MKLIAIAILALSLSGCAGLTAYMQGHAAQIGMFTVGAAAISSGEGVIANGLAIRRELSNGK